MTSHFRLNSLWHHTWKCRNLMQSLTVPYSGVQPGRIVLGELKFLTILDHKSSHHAELAIIITFTVTKKHFRSTLPPQPSLTSICNATTHVPSAPWAHTTTFIGTWKGNEASMGVLKSLLCGQTAMYPFFVKALYFLLLFSISNWHASTAAT